MEIDSVEIQKEIINKNTYYLVIIEVEGYCYSCRWIDVEPSQEEIYKTFKDRFNDEKTWVNY